MPLHSTDITKRAVDKGLLSHVGKTPEITMLSRLAAMAKRPRDRKLQVTTKDTFALTDWMLPEDPDALTTTGVMEPNAEEALPPYRPNERHPRRTPSTCAASAARAIASAATTIGRRSSRPIAEVACEVLQECADGAGGQRAARAHQGARRRCRRSAHLPRWSTGWPSTTRSASTTAASRSSRPLAASRTICRSRSSPRPRAALRRSRCSRRSAARATCPFENGRVVLRSEQRARNRAGNASPAAPWRWRPAAGDVALFQTARHAGKDARKAMARDPPHEAGGSRAGNLREVVRAHDARAPLPRAEGGAPLEGRSADDRAASRGQPRDPLRGAHPQGWGRRRAPPRPGAAPRAAADRRQRRSAVDRRRGPRATPGASAPPARW